MSFIRSYMVFDFEFFEFEKFYCNFFESIKNMFPFQASALTNTVKTCRAFTILKARHVFLCDYFFGKFYARDEKNLFKEWTKPRVCKR